MKSRITVGGLALLVKRGFEDMERNFNKRFDVLELELARVNRRLDKAVYQPELLSLERRVGRLEKRAGLA